MSVALADDLRAAHVGFVLRLGDSALILGQRLSEWCGHAPVLEEDLALANVALDLIGQARLLLSHAGALEGRGRDEDQLAFLRTEREFRNVTMVELPNGDFARTVLRNFLVAAFQREVMSGLQGSADAALAAIAVKSLKETRYNLEHAAGWVVRLGDGTDESHARIQRAVDELWPYTEEWFAPDTGDEALAGAGIAVCWSNTRGAWTDAVTLVLEEATLVIPAGTAFRSTGRLGVHGEHLGPLLSEMQVLQRTYPGATW